MIKLHEKFVTDKDGRKVEVILPYSEYEKLIKYLQVVECDSLTQDDLDAIEEGRENLVKGNYRILCE